VHDAAFMRVSDGVANDAHDPYGFVDGQWARADSSLKIRSIDEIHGDEIATARKTTNALKADNIWVIQASQDLSFLQELFDRVSICLSRFDKRLDRHLRSRGVPRRSIDLAHATRTQESF
jgi:hypothetical protein